jgi:hypothetical protein
MAMWRGPRWPSYTPTVAVGIVAAKMMGKLCRRSFCGRGRQIGTPAARYLSVDVASAVGFYMHVFP